MQMIFKLTEDFIQHLIHQHCCHTRAAQRSEPNRSKNPILISPAWIAGVVCRCVVHDSHLKWNRKYFFPIHFQASTKNEEKKIWITRDIEVSAHVHNVFAAVRLFYMCV